jgi:RNA polymerase sigma-70 factor (ECF subfamily)
MPDGKDFVEMLMAENRTLYAFAYSICRSHADAEDIVQQASSVMWKKFDTYDPNRSFGAWARAILYRTAMNHVRKRGKRPVLCDPEILEQLVDAYDEVDDCFAHDRLLDALRACVRKLPALHRRMVEMRYIERKPSVRIGEALDRSVQAINTALLRIRRRLEICIRASLQGEEA